MRRPRLADIANLAWDYGREEMASDASPVNLAGRLPRRAATLQDQAAVV